jgi:hypothetical protein
MKLIKFVLSAVLVAGVLTSTAGTSAAAPAAVQATVTLQTAVLQINAQLALGNTAATSDPFYLRVSGRGDGYCLDNFASGGGANNSPVGLWTCNGGATEQWRLHVFNKNVTNDTNLVNVSSGRCLDYPASAGNNVGWQFNVYDCKNGAASGQNFQYLAVGGPAYLFSFEATNDAVAMDAFASFWHGDGSPVGLWPYAGGGNLLQHWY